MTGIAGRGSNNKFVSPAGAKCSGGTCGYFNRVAELDSCGKILRRAIEQVGRIIGQLRAAVRLRHRAASYQAPSGCDGNDLLPTRMPRKIIVGILQTREGAVTHGRIRCAEDKP